MGLRPTVERPPGFKQPWYGVWGYAFDEMKRVGTWAPAMRPFLDEYVLALRTAAEHREKAELEPVETNRESGLTHMHAGFASADRETRRAAMLAHELGLTPRAQKALKALAAEPPAEGSAAFAVADQLAVRRRAANA